MPAGKRIELDPLYVIFEQHLYNFQDSELDRKTFIENVFQDYLSFLRKKNISIPKLLEGPVAEELYNQIHVMLVKKIYGCLNLQDFQKKGARWGEKRKARSRYSRLKKMVSR